MAKKSKAKENPFPSEPTSKHEDGSEKDYEAEGAMNDLLRAEEHRKNPEMMKRVSKIAGRKVKALTGLKGVARIRAALNEKYGPGSEE